ncbi:MAG: TIGR00730 family Rossman fold protein [bacterium]|nr:TIGR00730 family Rossman fold protein [bacterium]
MTNIKNICVFASASNDLAEVYYKDAQELGKLIAQKGFGIVYGGSRRGLMYACAGAVKEMGGKVYGIMPEKLANVGLANPEDCDEFYITKGMRERKAKLDELSDAVIAIAGGFGTLEEISEMITQKQLGYSNKPIVIMNTNGLYNHLIEFFEKIIEQGFADKELRKVYYVANSPEDALNYIENYHNENLYVKYRSLN